MTVKSPKNLSQNLKFFSVLEVWPLKVRAIFGLTTFFSLLGQKLFFTFELTWSFCPFLGPRQPQIGVKRKDQKMKNFIGGGIGLCEI